MKESGRYISKVNKLKKFYSQAKVLLFFKTFFFNFEAAQRREKTFALWKIYIPLTKTPY